MIEIINNKGEGRPFIVLFEDSTYQELAKLLFAALSVKSRTLLLKFPKINATNWSSLTDQLLKLLRDQSIRQVSVVGFGAACAIAQNLALHELKLVRAIVLVDATTRPHPSFFTRCIDWLEAKLPLGLPLRSYGKDFDSKPFLQRIRCPVLVVFSLKASLYIRSQAEVLATLLPSAWMVALKEPQSEELQALVLEFQNVPAKCPQKNVGNL